MNERVADIAVAGAGIAGLAHAWLAARAGKRVVVFEKNPRPAGASLRNFGLLWPVGQPCGEMHSLALRSRELWLEMLGATRISCQPTGSLHLAYRRDEADVCQEFATKAPGLGYDCAWIGPAEVERRSAAARRRGLLGALWSPTEITVDPAATNARLIEYLAQLGVVFRFGAPVRAVELPRIECAGECWEAERLIICSGDEFALLYPELFRHAGMTRCKLQMMSAAAPDFRLGPALAGGLTLRFYGSFAMCASRAALAARIAEEMPEYEHWGIHVMVSQTPSGELKIGDSHEYGDAVDFFDKPEIDRLILDYLATFATLEDTAITRRWHGVYAKHPEKPFVRLEPAPGVSILTGLGGAGMTLSFGLAERTLA